MNLKALGIGQRKTESFHLALDCVLFDWCWCIAMRPPRFAKRRTFELCATTERVHELHSRLLTGSISESLFGRLSAAHSPVTIQIATAVVIPNRNRNPKHHNQNRKQVVAAVVAVVVVPANANNRRARESWRRRNTSNVDRSFYLWRFIHFQRCIRRMIHRRRMPASSPLQPQRNRSLRITALTKFVLRRIFTGSKMDLPFRSSIRISGSSLLDLLVLCCFCV